MAANDDADPRDHHLIDFAGRKVIVECARCGMRRQYDANEMLARIGDIRLPELRLKIARAEGCERVEKSFYDRCRLAFNPKEMGYGDSYGKECHPFCDSRTWHTDSQIRWQHVAHASDRGG